MFKYLTLIWHNITTHMYTCAFNYSGHETQDVLSTNVYAVGKWIEMGGYLVPWRVHTTIQHNNYLDPPPPPQSLIRVPLSTCK